jgi:hypothetical protein
MHKSIISVIVISLAILLAACDSKSDLEKNLGDFRFIGLTPRLTMRILKREVVMPNSEYGRPTLKVTGVIQQDGDFPVAHYIAHVTLVVRSAGKEVGSSLINASVEGKSAAFTEDIYLGEGAGKAPAVESLKIEVDNFQWFPKRNGKKDIALEITH